MRKLSTALGLLGFLIVGAGCQSSALFEQGRNGSGSGSDGQGSGADGLSPGVAPAASASFEAMAPATYTNKIKTILTGLPASDAEIATVAKDSKALRSLITTWMATPGARQVQQDFLANALQQQLVTAAMFPANLGDLKRQPTDELVLNFRQSLAKTAMQFGDDNQPFTQIANTQRFMMTTAMLSWLSLNDMSYADDAAKLNNRFLKADPAWGFTLSAKQTVPLSSAVDPKSPQYANFNVPDLAKIWAASGTAAANTCAGVDPITPAMFNAFYTTGATPGALYMALSGQPFSFKTGQTTCKSLGSSSSYLEAQDYADWRMVTVTTASGDDTPPAFFDVPTLRSASTIALTVPLIGYFTSPAFLAQWPTNTSNVSRLTANQTLITGLGFQVDGADQLPMTSPTAVDQVHAADPACFACHQTLDPYRQFFRQSFSLYYGLQSDPNQAALPATFAFRKVQQSGKGVLDLANIIAAHPNFASAWTLKVCNWLNSSNCDPSDPEVIRIANVFSQSNYSFPTLMSEVAASPISTYAVPTVTANANQTISIARQPQLCNILSARLGQTDLCALNSATAPAPGSIASLAANLPPDTYTRGQTAPQYVTQSDPFGRNTLESLCMLTAQEVVDSTNSPFIQSSDSTGAIKKIVSDLMGITPNNPSNGPINDILTAHYKDAVAAGSSATSALQSTFVLGCTSPYVASVGI